MEATFHSILHLLAWNGYEDEAYKGSQACRETWEDTRILRPRLLNKLFSQRRTTLIGIHAYYDHIDQAFSLARIKHLVSLGADPDLSNETTLFTPLMDLCIEGDHYKMDLFTYILSLDVRVDGPPDNAWCPLSLLATGRGSKRKMEMLLAKGADIHRIDRKGYSILSMSCWMDTSYTSDNVKFLCQKGADVHTVNINGNTALDICLNDSREFFAEVLLSHGAEIPEGAMQRAIRDTNKPIIRLLQKHGIALPEDSLTNAILIDDADQVGLLLDCGMSPNDGDISPLHQIVTKRPFTLNQLRILEYLCSAGARVNRLTLVKTYNSLTLAYTYVEEPILYNMIRLYICKRDNLLLAAIKTLVDYGAVPPPPIEYSYISPYSKDPLDFGALNSILHRARGVH
jgi:ankyrin repeat protein